MPDLISPEFRETLRLVASGYTDKEVCLRQHLAPRGVQSRLHSIAAKLKISDAAFIKNDWHANKYNMRSLVIATALSKGIISVNDLDTVEYLR